MSDWLVRGGTALTGTVTAQGSKNAALPILAATLLIKEPVRLQNCPRLRDVGNMLHILESLGCTVYREEDDLKRSHETTIIGCLSHARNLRMQ